MSGVDFEVFFIPPVFTSARDFSVGMTSGVLDKAQLALLADEFDRGGLKEMAAVLHFVRQGYPLRAQDFRRVIERLAVRDQARLKEVLARLNYFAELNRQAMIAALQRARQEVYVNGGVARKMPPAKTAKPVQMASGGGQVYSVSHPSAVRFIDALNEAIRPGDVTDFLPPTMAEELDVTFKVLDGMTEQHQTGEDVQRLLIKARIGGRFWTHTNSSGSYTTLRNTPKVEGASKPGALNLVALPEDHLAPTHIHQSGSTHLPGEGTVGLVGLLGYRDYKRAESSEADILIVRSGEIRISPDGSRDVFVKQRGLWVGAFWQPELAQTVRGEFVIPTLRQCIDRCREQLASLEEVGIWKTTPPSDELARKIESFEKKWESIETRELTGIADSNYIAVTNGRASINKWPTEALKELARARIEENLAGLTAIAKILAARGVL